jgi:hypothetical protein
LNPKLLHKANHVQTLTNNKLPSNTILHFAYSSRRCFPRISQLEPEGFDFALSVIQDSEIPQLGDPGSDPLPFLPEPN